MNRIPVSVIVPCWRCADSIALTVDSILAQTARPAEVWLIDDASADDGRTLTALHEQAARSDAQTTIHVVAQAQNGGPGGARNAGWDRATQPYLAFLDADDVWHPAKLAVQFPWMQAHPDVAISGHATALRPAGALPPAPATFEVTPVTLASMLVSCRFPTRTVMLKRELPFRFGGRELTEDYLLWLEVIAAGHAAVRLETTLAYSLRPDFDPGGYSGALWTHEQRELRALRVLQQRGYVGGPLRRLAQAWSFVKYLRRIRLQRARRL